VNLSMVRNGPQPRVGISLLVESLASFEFNPTLPPSGTALKLLTFSYFLTNGNWGKVQKPLFDHWPFFGHCLIFVGTAGKWAVH